MAAGADGRGHTVVAFGDHAVDLFAARRCGALEVGLDPGLFATGSLNALLAEGRAAWQAVRNGTRAMLEEPGTIPGGVLVPRAGLAMRLPVEVGDFVDGYGGIHHAENMGRLLRPEAEPLSPNWRRMPVAYHARAGTVVVSGCPVHRPWGQVPADGEVRLAPTGRLDLELEVGFVIGAGNARGRPVAVDHAAEHIFGLVLLNDWSARDIQALESRPLGPFLGKSFATSISAWVVTLDALEPHLVAGLPTRQEPPAAPYLRSAGAWVPDLHLEVLIQSAAMRRAGRAPVVVSRVAFADAMYWSMAQQLAHATVNGASTRPGDLFGSGTASGPDPRRQGGSLMELSWGGTSPIELPGGERRAFLDDGDTVVLRGWCGDQDEARAPISMGEVVGTVVAAPPAPGPR